MSDLKERWLKAMDEFWAEETAAPEARRRRSLIRDDIPSFMELPVAWGPDDLSGADAAFIGIPWEGMRWLNSTTWVTSGGRPADPDAILDRSGAYDAPEWIRRYSTHYSIHCSGSYWPEVGSGFRLLSNMKVMDYGDVEIKEGDVEETARRAIDKVSDIVKAGAMPLVCGGDHAVAYMVMRAISDNTQGKTGIITFDSHQDLAWGERLTSGNIWARVLDTCDVDPTNLVEIGIRGTVNREPWQELARDLGITIFTIADVEDMGMKEVIGRAADIAGQGTERIYVSLDVDAIDPVDFPAQKWPDPFGLTSRQMREALQVLSRETNMAGFDIVCVGPAYDYKGLAAMTCSRFYIEALTGLALRKGSQVGAA
jgi:arginase family enzyme